MKNVQEKYRTVATLLSFALIPLSGLATDIYIPSLPSMAAALHVSDAQVQVSILIFLVSAGVSQLFVGTLLDAFGRFHLSNGALLIFVLSCFIIAWFPDIRVLYGMRVIHGITVAAIVVAKRAYFMDSFSGDRLKRYTSLFSIVWATSPIVAPFLGGYLQASFGWKADFYFLGGLTGLILLLTLLFSGESIRVLAPFDLRAMTGVYINMLRTRDFSLALMIIGLTYSILMVFGMTGPFIIEQVYHHTPIATGYSALLSGVAVMSGGILSRTLINRSLGPKIGAAIFFQLVAALMMWGLAWIQAANFYVLMFIVILLHIGVGFIFNSLFAFSLGRFSRFAGIVSGLTGGGLYVITSFFSYGAVHLLPIHSAGWLAITDIILILLNALFFGLFLKARRREESRQVDPGNPVDAAGPAGPGRIKTSLVS